MTVTNRRQALLAIGGGAVGFAAGAAWSPRANATATSSAFSGGADEPTEADIGFCRDMTAHHVQAVVMCERVLGRDTGDAVQAAATEVLRNQAIEIGTMRAWLADWGESTASPEIAMAWMGMNDGAGMPLAMMPGLASEDELRALSLTTGLAQGRQWLELMRAHHVGGVAMAEAAVDLTALDKVRRLAGIQAEVQTFEISQYDLLLATAYA
ncbi:MAG: DUF305 domain-containing protein [Actinomycetota bacterium]